MEDVMLKQLKAIKWLLLIITSCIFIAAASLGYFSYFATKIAEDSLSSSSCGEGEESSRDKVSNLIDEGKTDEAIAISTARIKSHPNDEDGYWYRGISLYLQKKWQPAIDDFNKTEELVPSWKDQYTEPYRAAAQNHLQNR